MTDAETKIIPGHGPLSNRAELAAYVEMLTDVRAKVAALVDAGKSLEEAIAAKPTAAWDDPWGKVFINPEQFTTIVYQILAGDG